MIDTHNEMIDAIDEMIVLIDAIDAHVYTFDVVDIVDVSTYNTFDVDVVVDDDEYRNMLLSCM